MEYALAHVPLKWFMADEVYVNDSQKAVRLYSSSLIRSQRQLRKA